MGLRHLIVFTTDLRLHDNQAFAEAARNCDELLCLFCIDSFWQKPGRFQSRPMGEHRHTFLRQSLTQLNQALGEHDQRLICETGNPLSVISSTIQQHQIGRVFYSEPIGWNERQLWQKLRQHHANITFSGFETHTLFEANSLPFELEQLPETFSRFRKQVKSTPFRALKEPPITFPPPVAAAQSTKTEAKTANSLAGPGNFHGGELAGREHLNHYFDSSAPSSYKLTRNALDDWESSTKFSPWLALGCLSARQIIERLRLFEHTNGANESTEWIEFELLWREYFQWYALAHGAKLFRFRGIKDKGPLNSFYPSHFLAWCQGQTHYPIVNACMKQLNATGYLSNRGRQLVASCFVHELQLDWRYGAAYFEQQLVDYDVASNWGNWQYLAGVGADPRGWRQFDLEKQTKLYDPDGQYIKKWQGQVESNIVEFDAADWPVTNQGRRA